jgi:hypothetical protein
MPSSPDIHVTGWVQMPGVKMFGTLNDTSALECRRRGFGGEVPSKIRDAQYWLDRAEEARLQAEEMTYADSRREMLQIAAAYRKLARHAEERTAGKRSRA